MFITLLLHCIEKMTTIRIQNNELTGPAAVCFHIQVENV